MRDYDSAYEESNLTFPHRDIPECQKTEKYHCQWAKAMWSAHTHDKSAIPFSYSDTIRRLRDYGKGRQSVDQYLKQQTKDSSSSTTVSVDGTTQASVSYDRKGLGNIDTSIISVASRVKSMIKAYLKNIREDIMVDAIDPVSGAEQEDEKWRTMLYAKNKDFIEGFQRRAGIDVETPEFLPETIDELEMYNQAGGFKLAHASTIGNLVKYTIELSGYEDELENQVYDDLMDIGIACTKTKLDPETLKYKDHYIDVEQLAVQHSRHNDFYDIEWVGHRELYTIANLRKFFPDIKESVFRDIAYAYTGRLNNPGEFQQYDKVADFGGHGYDQFSVEVFEAEWKDHEIEEAMFYDNKISGKTTRIPVNEETLKRTSNRQRYVKSCLEKRRQCSWVVGTPHVFDWGVVNMQDRPQHNKTVSNYHIRALSDNPLMVQLLPILDDLQISWLRWQDARSRSVPDGYAVNIAKLKNISDGQKVWKIHELLKLWRERGLLMYQDSLTGKYEGGKTIPIDRLPSTLLDELQEFAQAWDHALKRMEDLTGINALLLGATPDPNAPVGTQKMSVQSSASAIRPLGLAMSAIKRESAESFMRRFSLAAKARKDIVRSYEGVVGKNAIKRVVEAGRSMADYGMTFHSRPTDAEKAALLDAANISMQNRREGRPGIDLQTKMFIEEQLYSDVNLKWLRVYIGYKEKQIYKQDQEQKERMINLQADRNDRSAQIAAQGEMQKKKMEIDGDMAVEKRRTESDVIRELVKKDDAAAKQIVRKMGIALVED